MSKPSVECLLEPVSQRGKTAQQTHLSISDHRNPHMRDHRYRRHLLGFLHWFHHVRPLLDQTHLGSLLGLGF